MNKEDKKFKLSLFTIFVAVVLWYLMFVVKLMNFWTEMSLSIALLVILGILIKRDLLEFHRITKRQIFMGIASFIVLYFVFYIGNIISGYILPFKDAQISMVYNNKTQSSSFIIGILLLFIIGPGEEIFWRGFIQNTFESKFGENKGYVIASLVYGGVHIITGNFMLVVAAMVCGLYWGYLYKKEKSLMLVILSHALWDFTIFVLFPLK
jgi:uncharacterized protein